MHIVKLIKHILYFILLDINFIIVIDINQRNSHKILQVPCCPTTTMIFRINFKRKFFLCTYLKNVYRKTTFQLPWKTKIYLLILETNLVVFSSDDNAWKKDFDMATRNFIHKNFRRKVREHKMRA